MDSYYSFSSAVDASSPDSISPPASVCASSSDFIYAQDVPSPELQSEFDSLNSQSLGTQYVQTAEHSTTSHPDPGIQSTTYHRTTPNPTTHMSNSPTDFDFMNSLLSIRGTRDQSGGDQGGEGIDGPTESEAAVAETIVRARKSWKTVKGRSEPVWPPYLEKALVQALLQYKPHDSRYARALGRFPKRNRYISDYIYETTGVRRTPKQVGSRLQQLKDVSCGKMLLNHVASWALQSSPKNPSASNDAGVSPSNLHSDLNMLISNMHGNCSDSPSPVTPPGSGGLGMREASLPTLSATKPHGLHPAMHPTPHSAAMFDSPPVTPVARRMDVFVPFDPVDVTGRVSDEGNGSERGSPLVHFGGCLARPETVFAPQPVDSGRVLGRMEPRATFSSRDPIAARSIARVWVDNTTYLPSMVSSSHSHGVVQSRIKSEKPGVVQAHQYGEPLVCMQTPAARASAAQTSFYSTDNVALKDCDEEDRDCFIYGTRLVDEAIWYAMRREGPGLRRYTITQELIHSLDSPTTRRGEIFLVITYRFVPISSTTCPPYHSMLSPLDTRGQGCGLNYRRGSVSPASSETTSPANSSPSTLGPGSAGGMTGRDQAYRMMHNAQPYPRSQMRVPQVSIQPNTSTVPDTTTLMSPFGQDGYYNVNMNSGTSSEFDADFSAIDMGSLHLSTNSAANVDFYQTPSFC